MTMIELSQLLGNIGEFIGAIAVLISILYLAYQIRQNTKMMQGATVQAITQTIQSENKWSSELGPIYEKAVQGEKLTWLDRFQLGEWLTAALTARQNEFYQYRSGLLDEEMWKASEGIIRSIMLSPHAKKWWRSFEKYVFHDEFVQLVDKIVEADIKHEPVSDQGTVTG
jgi:hypothetical protein